MTEMTAERAAALYKLREPFDKKHVGKLPRVTCRACSNGNCNQHQKTKCRECDAWISTAHIHLDFVGHAETTNRFLEADLEWSWRPMATTPQGLPMFDGDGGMWIYLTIAGVERLGYGSANGKKGPDAIKEVIGDALRNAGMRFGVALELWSKTDLEISALEFPEPGPEPERLAERSAPIAPVEDQWSTRPDAEPKPTLMANQGQRTNLVMRFGEKGITDRAERLGHTSALLGRSLGSFTELTFAEYQTVAKALHGGWPHIQPGPTPLPEPPADLEDNPVRDILASGIADANSPATLKQAGEDIAKELTRGTITPDESKWLKVAWKARQDALRAEQAQVAA